MAVLRSAACGARRECPLIVTLHTFSFAGHDDQTLTSTWSLTEVLRVNLHIAQTSNKLHYPNLLEHLAERPMYLCMPRNCYWSRTADKMYSNMWGVSKCTKNMAVQNLLCSLKLQLSSQPLAVVAVDFLGPLLRTSKDSQLVVMVLHRYQKLTRIVPTGKRLSRTLGLCSWITSLSVWLSDSHVDR